MKTIDDAISTVVSVRDRYVDYAGNGRCANWDEYTKISGAVTACDKVLAELESLRGDIDED
jgi:hypothetical protein